MLELTTVEQIAEHVRAQSHMRVTGGGTKPATSANATVSLSGLAGVLQYEPAEYTFTALAGTRLDDVQQMLAAKNQYLPFDPPWSQAGATLGGTVAAGLSGAGRYRYGGVRDFLLGVQLVTGKGEIVTTGSKVVKNAAGFDIPKLMVGSLGEFGVMTELTFKVFPAPQSTATIVLDTENVDHAVTLMNSLATSQLDLASLDLDTNGRIWARVAGLNGSVEARTQRVLQIAEGSGKVIPQEQDAEFWRSGSEFQWVPEGHALIKAAITPNSVSKLAAAWGDLPYRISVGGHLAWLTWPQGRSRDELQALLGEIGCPGIALTGNWPSPWVGESHRNKFYQGLRDALDPEGMFRLASPVSV